MPRGDSIEWQLGIVRNNDWIQSKWFTFQYFPAYYWTVDFKLSLAFAIKDNWLFNHIMEKTQAVRGTMIDNVCSKRILSDRNNASTYYNKSQGFKHLEVSNELAVHTKYLGTTLTYILRTNIPMQPFRCTLIRMDDINIISFKHILVQNTLVSGLSNTF